MLQAGQGTPAEDWAHHVEQSATVGDEDAVAALVRAAEAIRFRAPRTAAQWFGSANRLLPDRNGTDHNDTAPRRAALLLSQAEALAMAGELRPSRATVGEVLAMLIPESDDYLRAVLHAALVEALRASAASAGGWFAAWAGAVLAADAVQNSSAEQSALTVDACGGPDLPLFDPGIRPEFYELLTRAAVRIGDQARASAWASRASAAAATASLPDAAGFAALAQSHARTAAGDAAGAARYARDAVRPSSAPAPRSRPPGRSWSLRAHSPW